MNLQKISGAVSLEKRFRGNHGLTIFLVIGLLLITGAILNPGFLSPANIGNILAIAVVLAMGTAGQTLVMVSGAGVDISIGAMMSLGAILTVEIQNQNNAMIIPSILVIIVAGILIGLLNAVGVIRAKVPALVMTFATANIIQSIQSIYTKGSPHGKPAPLVSAVGTTRIFPWLPWLTLVAVITAVVMYFLLQRSVFGKRAYAAGANENAAVLSGIRTDRVRILAFVLSGVFSGLAGFWFAAYNTFMKVGAADYLALPILAAVLIGGTPFPEGRGPTTARLPGRWCLRS